MKKQGLTVVVVLLWCWVALLIYRAWQRKARADYVAKVHSDNVAAVQHFQKYGGGF